MACRRDRGGARMARARAGAAADALHTARAAGPRRRRAGPPHAGVGRSRQPIGRGVPHAGDPRPALDGARVDRRGTDRAAARRGAVAYDADGGRTMTTINADLYASVAARERHVARGLANTHPIFVERAEGTRVWDVAGKEYLDFTSGIGVLNTGHRHPRVVAAVQDQLGRLMHTCFQVTMYEPYVELAARLCALVGNAATHKGVLFTTGAEAIENAVKIARAYTKRSAVVAFSGGFHGRTLLALTMTASSPGYRQNFGPFAADVYHTPFPDEYHGWTSDKAIDALEQLFSTEIMPEQVAAVVIEPQLGEGGFIPAPP